MVKAIVVSLMRKLREKMGGSKKCGERKRMAKAMIVSLGGSPEPISKSIKEHKPEYIIFFASHDSVLKEGEVTKDLNPRPRIETEITENPNSLNKCYQAAKRCLDRFARSGIDECDLVVDYTGGTKVMSAALLLAAAGMKCGFNYVGGEARTKDGLGIVIDGHEIMYSDMNPWAAFAEEERRQVVTLFNARHYSAVLQVIGMCKVRKLPYDIEMFFNFTEQLASALLFWDQFQHDTALRCLKRSMELLDRLPESGHYSGFTESFRDYLSSLSLFLEALSEKKDKLKRYDMLLVTDIINNARRRIDDEKYDDAAARLYRALEMYGQIVFENEFGVSNDKVRPDVVPESIRGEFVRKYMDNAKGIMKLPLQATFIALNEKGNGVGKRYMEFLNKIRNIQTNRNNSILAHGIQPVTDHAINQILSIVVEFMELNPDKDFFDFPRLP